MKLFLNCSWLIKSRLSGFPSGFFSFSPGSQYNLALTQWNAVRQEGKVSDMRSWSVSWQHFRQSKHSNLFR